MTLEEERFMVEYIWNGDYKVVTQLSQMRNSFKRYPEILKWLVKNEVRGQSFIDFFNDAEGVETRGVIVGVKKILNRIDSTPFNKEALTVKDLK